MAKKVTLTVEVSVEVAELYESLKKNRPKMEDDDDILWEVYHNLCIWPKRLL